MKHITNKLVLPVIIFSMVLGMLSVPVKTDAKSTYRIQGVSKPAGGKMGMYYKGMAILIKGSYNHADISGKATKLVKKASCKYKVASHCKVCLYEAENVFTYPYKKWVRKFGYKKNDEISFISVDLKIDGKNITKIDFSA